MRWKRTRRSDNVEDRRAQGGGSGRFPGGKAGMGLGGIILALIAMFATGNLNLDMLGGMLGGGVQAGAGGSTGGNSGYKETAEDKEKIEFVRHVLGDTEDVWGKIFRDAGKVYERPKLVVFHNATSSACGHAQSATGPFYCPADSKVYLDLSFFKMLSKRFGAPGDFAQAYVVAHEVAHHIQNLLGYSDMVHRKRQQLSKTEYNKYSVALELQADFLAGVWAHHTKQRGLLDAGDREEALNCAMRIGDDTLQKQSGGRVRPDSFTHGTAKQRAYWFNKGFTTGDLNQGDTFRALGLKVD